MKLRLPKILPQIKRTLKFSIAEILWSLVSNIKILFAA